MKNTTRKTQAPPLVLCIIPAERSALSTLIKGAGGTPVIDITSSKRGPMPKGAWVRTRNRRTAPGKGPVLLAGGNHRQPIRGRETWLETTSAIIPPKGFAGIVLRGPNCGGMHGEISMEEMVSNCHDTTKIIIEDGLWPSDIRRFATKPISGVILNEALIRMPEMGLPLNIGELLTRANRSFFHDMDGVCLMAPPLSEGLQALATGGNWWKLCQDWFEKDSPNRIAIPLGPSLLRENSDKIESIPDLIQATLLALTSPSIQTTPIVEPPSKTPVPKANKDDAKTREVPTVVQPREEPPKPPISQKIELPIETEVEKPIGATVEKAVESKKAKPTPKLKTTESTESTESTEETNPDRVEPIAIIGMGCRFPQAENIDRYWQNILDKKCAIDNVPRSRWDDRLYFDEDRSTPDKTYSKIGAFIGEFSFDPKSFRIPPAVVKHVDPVQQIALSSAADALKDAGYLNNDKVNRERIAVILGNSMGGEMGDDYTLRSRFPEVISALKESPAYRALSPDVQEQLKKELQTEYQSQLPEVTADAMPGELSNVIAGRIANAFNLHGPSYTIDAACASSMAAIQAAVKGLRDREFDMALTGGADRSMGASTYIKFAKIGALSATGSRPFDQDANGFVMGEGCGILALKRVSDAQKDGDKIYAVIDGIGASSDGKGKGITAPNPIGQRLALQRSYQNGGVNPYEVDLVECHGTSTVVGDKVELETLAQYMGRADNPIRVGSVKSNIGHLKSAAGAASMIKAALAIYHGVFPPTANCQNPRKDIEINGIAIQTEALKWHNTTRRAGVSAFGFGGINFHACLSNQYDWIQQNQSTAPPQTNPTTPIPLKPDVLELPSEIWSVSAKNKDQLLHKINHGDNSLSPEDQITAAIVYKNAAEKDHSLQEAAKVISKTQNLSMLRNKGIHIENTMMNGDVAVLFTGQGSQYIEMGMELAAHYPIVQQTFDEADAILEPLFQKKLTDYIRRDPNTMETLQFAQLRETQIAQPATLTIDIALYRLLKSFGLKAHRVAGHSLGEYAACVAAEVMSFKDALLAVCARGKGMAAIELEDSGTMASIGTHPDKVRAILKDIDGYVIAANMNAPSQTVIAGETAAMAQAITTFKSKGFMVQPLAVSHAFHTKLVSPASEPLRKVLNNLDISRPTIPINSNVTGEWYPSNADAIRDLLAMQVASPVKWIKQVESLYEEGVRIFIECGPKRALSGMVASILKRKPHRIISTNDPRKGDVRSFHDSLAALFALNRLNANTHNAETTSPISADQKEKTILAGGDQIKMRKVVVCSGAAVGLPGGKEVFAADNVERLLAGENRIQQIDLRSQDRFLSKRIVRVQKNANTGQGDFITVNKREQVIKLAGRKSHFDLSADYGIDQEMSEALDITTQLAFAAGIEALRDAKIPLIKTPSPFGPASKKSGGFKLPKHLQEETGVIFASAFPGYANFVKHIRRNGDDGHGQFDRRFLFQVLAMGHSQFAQHIGAKGPNTHVNAACASTTQAIGIAQDWIENGRAKRVIVIGADDVTSPEMMEWIGSGFLAVGAATTKSDVKEAALPFDQRRHGMILGMGAVGLVLEDERETLKRGKQSIARLIASQFSNSAYHGARIESAHIAQEMKGFIEKTTAIEGIKASEFAKECLFVSHETYTPARGGSAAAEIESLNAAFAEAAKDVVITNTKGYTGHAMAAGIEDVVAVKALEFGMAPPIPNIVSPDPELGPLSLADGSRFKGRYALRLAAGFGSQIAFLAWEKTQTSEQAQNTDALYNQWLSSVCDQPDMQLVVQNRTLIAVQKTGANRLESEPATIRSAQTAVLQTVAEATGIDVEDIDLHFEFGADLGISTMALSTMLSAWTSEFAKKDALPDQLLSPDLQLDAVVAWLNDVPPKVDVTAPKRVATTSKPAIPIGVEVGERVLRTISEHTGYEIKDLEFDYELEADLGIDTVKQAEIFANLREMFNMSTTLEMNFDGAPTIRDVTDWIVDKIQPAAATSSPTITEPEPVPAKPVHVEIPTEPATFTEPEMPSETIPITKSKGSKRSTKVSRWIKRKRRMQLSTAENNKALPADRMKEPEYFAKLDALLAADELFQQHVQELLPKSTQKNLPQNKGVAQERTYPFPIDAPSAEIGDNKELEAPPKENQPIERNIGAHQPSDSQEVVQPKPEPPPPPPQQKIAQNNGKTSPAETEPFEDNKPLDSLESQSIQPILDDHVEAVIPTEPTVVAGFEVTEQIEAETKAFHQDLADHDHDIPESKEFNSSEAVVAKDQKQKGFKAFDFEEAETPAVESEFMPQKDPSGETHSSLDSKQPPSKIKKAPTQPIETPAPKITPETKPVEETKSPQMDVLSEEQSEMDLEQLLDYAISESDSEMEAPAEQLKIEETDNNIMSGLQEEAVEPFEEVEKIDADDIPVVPPKAKKINASEAQPVEMVQTESSQPIEQAKPQLSFGRKMAAAVKAHHSQNNDVENGPSKFNAVRAVNLPTSIKLLRPTQQPIPHQTERVNQTPTIQLIGSNELASAVEKELTSLSIPMAENGDYVLDLSNSIDESWNTAKARVNNPPQRWICVTDSGEMTLDQATSNGGRAGLCKALGREWNACQSAVLTLNGDTNKRSKDIVETLFGKDLYDEIAIFDGRKSMVAYDEIKWPNHAVWNDVKTVVLVGGGRGITAEVAKGFARRGPTKLFILGRTLPAKEVLNRDSARELIKKKLNKANKKATPAVINASMSILINSDDVRQTLSTLKEMGADVEFIPCNITDESAVNKAFGYILSKAPSIDIVVHGAGSERSQLIQNKSQKDFTSVFAPKATGAKLIMNVVPEETLFVSMGSIAGRLGNQGQTDYAAANEALAHLCKQRNAALHVAWSAWDGPGMTSKPGMKSLLDKNNIELLPSVAAADALVSLTQSAIRGEVMIAGEISSLPLSCGHPFLLDMRIRGRKRQFSVDKSIFTSPWMADHMLQGRPLLPGVIALEIMAGAALSSHPKLTYCGATSVEFKSALKWHNKDDVAIFVETETTNLNTVRCIIRSARKAATGKEINTIHFSAVVHLTEMQPLEDLPEVIGGDYPIDKKEVYSRFFHGPSFQVIHSVFEISSNCISAEGRVNHSPIHNHLLTSPLCLETAFQAAGLHNMSINNAMALPLGFEELEFLEAPAENEPLLIAVVANGDTYDIDIDSEEVAILRLRGLRLVNLGPLPPNQKIKPPPNGWTTAKLIPSETSYSDEESFSEDEMKWLSKRGNEKRILDRLAGRTAAKRLISRFEGKTPKEIWIVNDKWGRPIFDQRMDISISHCQGIGYAALNHEGRVGVDIEYIEGRSPAFLKHWFTPLERQLCKQNPRHQTAIWALKEAMSKALGLGFRIHPREIKIIALSNFKAKIKLSGKAKRRLSDLGYSEINARIRTKRNLVTACVVLETQTAPLLIPSGAANEAY